eukprot:1733322-Pleurochrysis_carterae.AAC.1
MSLRATHRRWRAVRLKSLLALLLGLPTQVRTEAKKSDRCLRKWPVALRLFLVNPGSESTSYFMAID